MTPIARWDIIPGQGLNNLKSCRLKLPVLNYFCSINEAAQFLTQPYLKQWVYKYQLCSPQVLQAII